jgi:hypothetical protein
MRNEILIDRILTSPCFVIYGAQVVAYGACVALKSLYNVMPECFVVSRKDDNPTEIDGVPVKTITDCHFLTDTLFIIAVTEVLQAEICSAISERGYKNIFVLGYDEEYSLMSAYFDSVGSFRKLESTSKSINICDLGIYEVNHIKDKQLKQKALLSAWEASIQVGAALTDKRIAEICDNTGDNISAKNPQYAEMTAVYWLWKNTSHDYKGIAHYRRHLTLSDGQINALSKGKVDAVLPLPYLCCPNAISHYGRFVSKEVADVLLDALRVMYPGQLNDYLAILYGRYFYTCNLVIAKKTVYDDYCQWCFSMLSHMETQKEKAPDIETTRALAYSAEILTSLYFLYNAKKLEIRHTGRRIYV